MTVKVTVLGSGVWLGNRKEDRRGPAFLVEAGGKKIVVDCAQGTNYQLAKTGVDPNAIDAILITHLHPDHVAGLVPLLGEMYLTGRKKALRIYGPKNLEKFIGASEKLFTRCAGLLYRGKRTFAALTLRPNSFSFSVCENPSTFAVGRAGRVETFRMAHTRHSFGYRLSLGRKSVAFTGDTEYCHGLLELAKGADVLFCECSKMKHVKGHMHPEAIAKAALLSGPGKVALVHIYPDCDPKLAARKVKKLSGVRTIAARDLQVFVA